MAKDKTYVLGMFPYPSGEGLHVGHGRIFSAVDVMARYFRMKTHKDSYPLGRFASLGSPTSHSNVMSPMGWDAFGLPAENAAIKKKVNPMDIVPKNYGNFRRQMHDLSLSFDWEHELATTDPTYYGLTQWLFLQLYDSGLVFREEVAINWCPYCKTGLANEEVMADGTHERCGTVVGKKLLPQWVMKITKYAQRLLDGLDEDLDWPRGILEMQRNWIGKKEGAKVKFGVKSPTSLPDLKTLDVFTTRVDTIEGVTFIVVAPEKVKEWINLGWEASKEVSDYVELSLSKSEQTRLGDAGEKTGVNTGMVAVNPINKEEVPIWVADYVLSDVGTGYVMGVPFFDERDRAFANKFGLPVKPIKVSKTAMDTLVKDGLAEAETTWHLRDWVFSRQRYWGEPIPLVYCPKCGDENGVVPLPEKDLPLELPYLESYEPTDTGESPLSRVTDWVNTKCPNCGGSAKRETDTMPNWAGSCWYFLAFPFWHAEGSDKTKSTKAILDEYKKKSETPFSDFWKEVAKPEIDKWCPVDWYLGGAEHAVLHLLYARFWIKVFQDRGLVDFSEPFLRLRSVGMVLAEDGKKMSKSLGNVINPDDMVKQFGSDAVRLYEMFMGPWDQAISWDTRSLIGQKRFLERIMLVVSKNKEQINRTKNKNIEYKELQTSPKLVVEMNRLIERVEKGIIEQKFNTAIAGIMEFVNLWRNGDLVLSQDDVQKFAQLLSPFAPVAASEIYDKAADKAWPQMGEAQETALVPVTIAVQVNGKLRATVEVEGKIAKDQDQVMEIVMKDERVKKWVNGEVKKTIFVPGKLVNLVV